MNYTYTALFFPLYITKKATEKQKFFDKNTTRTKLHFERMPLKRERSLPLRSPLIPLLCKFQPHVI